MGDTNRHTARPDPRAEATMFVRTGLLVITATACASASWAQRPDIGTVGEIVVVGGLQKCPGRRESPSTVGVLIRRRGAAQDTLVREGGKARIVAGDIYRVDRHTDVRLKIASQLGNGWFVLSPELMCTERLSIDTVLPPYTRPQRGVYQVDVTDGVLQLGVLAGGALIKWYRKPPPGTTPPLGLIAAGEVGRVTGTELAVVSDSSGQRAVMYVLEGTIVLRDGTVVGAGQVFELGQGVAPRRLGNREIESVRLAEADLQFHEGHFPGWPRPEVSFWDKVRPALPWVGLAAGLVAVGIAVWPESPGPPPRRRANILIQLPL